MTEIALLLAQAVIVGCMAAWMITGVVDNWVHPALNQGAVAEVLRFEKMREDFPEDFEYVKYRMLDCPRTIRALFYALVAWETVAAILLTAGTGALLLAMGGLVPADLARFVAVLGALAFTMNWAGFLTGGNYFCYYYSHHSGQATHFKLLLWGVLATILLFIPAYP